MIRRFRQEGFAFKPAEGMRGHLVLILTGTAPDDPDTFLTLAGERYDAAALVAAARNTAALETQAPGANLSPFLIEERIGRIRPWPSSSAPRCARSESSRSSRWTEALGSSHPC